MRDRMERLVLLPFSIGCVSESSVEAIAVDNRPRRKNYKPDTNSKPPVSKGRRKEEDEESHSSSAESAKSNMKFPSISPRIHRLFKSFKGFSQLFVYKEEIEEAVDVEMEIGFPTDVKHVTHIGWDGSTNTNPMRGWDNLVAPELLPSDRDDLQSAPASLLQFDLSMAAQVARAPPINK